MPEKVWVDFIASVAIIVRRMNPAQVFLEMKDDRYPFKPFRGCLCFIGGGPGRRDRNPFDTVRREIMEELSLEKRTISTSELRQLGLATTEILYQTPRRSDVVPTEDDKKAFDELKFVLIEGLTPFGDWLHIVPKEVFDRADPENKQDGFTTISSYWVVDLSEWHWSKLVAFQQKFGNLSNESISIITSLGEIRETGMKVMSGHDRALQQFFLSYGFSPARQFPLIEGIESQPIGPSPASYEDYFRRYTILRRPT